MKIPAEALQLNFARSGPLKGQELAKELVTCAKQVGSSARKVLETSCVADLEKYLESQLSRKISMSQIEYIYAAALAGGAYSAENLPSRIRKISPDLAGDLHALDGLAGADLRRTYGVERAQRTRAGQVGQRREAPAARRVDDPARHA